MQAKFIEALKTMLFLLVLIFFPALAASELGNFISVQNGISEGTYGSMLIRTAMALFFLGLSGFFMHKFIK